MVSVILQEYCNNLLSLKVSSEKYIGNTIQYIVEVQPNWPYSYIYLNERKSYFNECSLLFSCLAFSCLLHPNHEETIPFPKPSTNFQMSFPTARISFALPLSSSPCPSTLCKNLSILQCFLNNFEPSPTDHNTQFHLTTDIYLKQTNFNG